eukprot:1154044-Pelagomonas_calceolata.AAC.2
MHPPPVFVATQNTCASLSSSDIKDVETSVAGARTEKVKAEQAEAAVREGRLGKEMACQNLTAKQNCVIQINMLGTVVCKLGA